MYNEYFCLKNGNRHCLAAFDHGYLLVRMSFAINDIASSLVPVEFQVHVLPEYGFPWQFTNFSIYGHFWQTIRRYLTALFQKIVY